MIFDRTKVHVNHDLAAANTATSNFFKTAAEDLIDRLQIIDKDYLHILNIGCRSGLLPLLKELYKDAQIIVTDISQAVLDTFEHDYKYALDEENIAESLIQLIPDMTGKYFDLIIFSLGLHKINDVQNFLTQINYLLKDDGIFIGNFVGGESLKSLRFKLFEAEAEIQAPHHPHILPFIHFDHVVMLLQHAGFAEIIVDYENIDLEFQSPIELIHALKKAGASNILANMTNYSLPKKLYSTLKSSSGIFTDRLQLIGFTASKSKNTIRLKSSNP